MILRRIGQLIPVLFIVTSIVFFVTRVIPGNPAAVILGPQASVEAVEKLTEELGLNRPILVQYTSYLLQILRFDFGKSYYYNEPVIKLIAERFPNTVLLSLVSLFLALLAGIPAGILSAIKQYSPWDYFVMAITLVGVSIPIFWMGLMVTLLFSVRLNWLPSFGMGSLSKGLWDVISHLLLPAVCLSTIPAANFARMTRSSMLEVIKSDYIKALRAKGLKEFTVIVKHGLKNAFPPIVTVIGIQTSSLLSGAILTETIFSWPGIGRLIVAAIGNRDYALVQSSVLFVAFIYALVNLLVDIVYIYLNPKVSFEGNAVKE
ncbi:MAG: ABC transporter permease [Treponema sp.]|nr:ABC transporter permease [Treponema sp.]